MAFRSLSRLSSALGAKASTLRSSLLNFLLQCVALHCFVLLSHLSMIPYLSFDRRVRDFSRHRICFFDVLLIINGYLLSLCMKFSRYIFSINPFESIEWRWGDSNPWPPACKAGALPTELHPHIGLVYYQLLNCLVGLNGPFLHPSAHFF